jgi:biofilm protein TabA
MAQVASLGVTTLAGLLVLATGAAAGERGEAPVASGKLADWKQIDGTQGLEAAFTFLAGTDLAALPLGRTTIDGDQVFAIVSEAETRAPEVSRFEAHRKYIDVQYLASGQELIGFAPVRALETTEPYDAAKDIEFFSRPAEYASIELRPGRFAVFVPGDGHMPSVHLDGPHVVRKVVVKISKALRDQTLGKLPR